MSEVLTFTAGSATIYGSLAGARAYLGVEFDEWDVATDGEVTIDMQRALVKARRFLDRLPWAPDWATFDQRDQYDLGTGDGDAAFPFRAGSYELAALLLEDDDALGGDQLRGVTSISAGGDSVSLALGVEQQPIPGRAYEILAPYLGSHGAGIGDPDGQAGCASSPFALDEGCEC